MNRMIRSDVVEILHRDNSKFEFWLLCEFWVFSARLHKEHNLRSLCMLPAYLQKQYEISTFVLINLFTLLAIVTKRCNLKSYYF